MAPTVTEWNELEHEHSGRTPRRTTAKAKSLAARPLDTPRRSRLLHSDIAALLAAIATCTIGVWAWHGGVSAFGRGWAPAATSLTQISGIVASLAGLFGVALVARPKNVERAFGLDQLFVWHRYLGEAMAIAVGVHVVAGLLEWTQGDGFWSAVQDSTGRQPYMAAATVGAVLIGVVTVTSLRSIRRKFAYETWYFLHLTAYFALAVSFSHQIVTGGDFARDTVARWIWIGLHGLVIAMLLWGRFVPTFAAMWKPLHVRSIERLTDDTASIVLGGPTLQSLKAEAGQFFLLRPLRRDLWWQTHPFSLAAAPTALGLEFSVKDRGDASAAIAQLERGTQVAIEGPYGICTPDVAAGRKLIFVAGGIGIAPIRALMQRLEPGSEPVLLYRARRTKDLVHLEELRRLADSKGGTVLTLVGPSASLADRDPFGADSLVAAVPDIAERVAVLCGPERLLFAARKGLIDVGVSSLDIHYERPWW